MIFSLIFLFPKYAARSSRLTRKFTVKFFCHPLDRSFRSAARPLSCLLCSGCVFCDPKFDCELLQLVYQDLSIATGLNYNSSSYDRLDHSYMFADPSRA